MDTGTVAIILPVISAITAANPWAGAVVVSVFVAGLIAVKFLRYKKGNKND